MRTIVEPGDVFIDGEGVAWVGCLNGSPSSPGWTSDQAFFVHLVYHTPKAKEGLSEGVLKYLEEKGLDHPESDQNVRIPVEILSTPFTLVAELGKASA